MRAVSWGRRGGGGGTDGPGCVDGAFVDSGVVVSDVGELDLDGLRAYGGVGLGGRSRGWGQRLASSLTRTLLTSLPLKEEP